MNLKSARPWKKCNLPFLPLNCALCILDMLFDQHEHWGWLRLADPPQNKDPCEHQALGVGLLLRPMGLLWPRSENLLRQIKDILDMINSAASEKECLFCLLGILGTIKYWEWMIALFRSEIDMGVNFYRYFLDLEFWKYYIGLLQKF